MAQPQATLALPTLADRAFDAPPPLAPPPLYDRPNIRNSARGPEQVLEEGAVRCAHDHEKLHTRKRPRGQRAEHQRQVSRADAVGGAGIVERLAFPHERGHAVTLAPRADDLHSRGARSGWSEGSGDSTAAYATRSRPPDRHFWAEAWSARTSRGNRKASVVGPGRSQYADPHATGVRVSPGGAVPGRDRLRDRRPSARDASSGHRRGAAGPGEPARSPPDDVG